MHQLAYILLLEKRKTTSIIKTPSTKKRSQKWKRPQIFKNEDSSKPELIYPLSPLFFFNRFLKIPSSILQWFYFISDLKGPILIYGGYFENEDPSPSALKVLMNVMNWCWLKSESINVITLRGQQAIIFDPAKWFITDILHIFINNSIRSQIKHLAASNNDHTWLWNQVYIWDCSNIMQISKG